MMLYPKEYLTGFGHYFQAAGISFIITFIVTTFILMGFFNVPNTSNIWWLLIILLATFISIGFGAIYAADYVSRTRNKVGETSYTEAAVTIGNRMNRAIKWENTKRAAIGSSRYHWKILTAYTVLYVILISILTITIWHIVVI